MQTLQTYPELVYDGGRLAARVWQTSDPAAAVAATLRHDAEALVLSVLDDRGHRIARGFAPGGIGAGF